MRSEARGGRAALLVAALGFMPLGAAAGGALGPYTISASETVVHDSNVYRAPDGDAVRADWLTSTALSGGVDESTGRLRLQATGSVQSNHYRRNAALDNTGYGLHASLQGSTVERLSGSIVYDTSRTLTSFATLSSLGSAINPDLRVPSLQTAQQLELHGQRGLASTLTLDLGFTHRSLAYSARAYAAQENSEETGSMRVVWRPSGILNANLSLRRAHGRYPNGVQTGPDTYLPDAYNRDDIDLGALWTPSGTSRVDVRISRTTQRNRQAGQRDFAGTTGNVLWAWQPAGKLNSTLSLSRDIGNQSTFFNFNGNARAALQNYDQLSTRAAATLVWDSTAKIQPSISATWLRRRLVSNLTLFGSRLDGSAGDDRLLVTSVAVRYLPTRYLATQCALSRERRTSDTALSYPYEARVASCLVSLTLQ